ncbi:hypothetical protein A2V71_01565 [Candidatus Berkelbacteria bacterium RBG_13_40_8]|uniref:5'-3' exonuclease domain-containing protein n=1 Tax=Candidatus Berkelbacteria bacterium RBG_13_40_8 TaxID=1797467 RepID=A0A1F5DNN7_9BACT|nr:MAG: hypothetical protein A2V71_01565 [Candidatus Berkelbacteria bacterium RBG_13_40_8]
MVKNRFVLIDAFALIHRAFHGIPPLTTKDGELVNAVYGFTSALLSSIHNLEPEYLVTGFDLPKPTKRKLEYVEYKAHRAAPPDELISQIPFVKEVLKDFNIPIISSEGYEGEDVIATVVAKSKVKSQKSKEMEFIIVTGDMDTLQLIDKSTKVYSMARGVNQAAMYDIEKVKERYGLTPDQFVDFKALKGDASDNIPGVPGIGEKGASKLISEYKNLDNLFKNIEKLSPKYQTLLKENKEQAYLSQKLSKICSDAPIDFELSSAKVSDYNKEKVIALFNKLGFKSLISRLPEATKPNQQATLF